MTMTTTTTTMNIADPILTPLERGPVPASLKRFIWDIQSMVELADSEREILVIGRDLMTRLVANDDWLPEAFAIANPGAGAQFQLYSDGLERFSVVGTILSGGAGLLIERPSIWEIMGVLRGAVVEEESLDSQAKGAGRSLPPRSVETRAAGKGDLLRLSNALPDQLSISIHVYGGEIGKLSRRALTQDGQAEERALGYANGENAPPYDILTIQTEILD